MSDKAETVSNACAAYEHVYTSDSQSEAKYLWLHVKLIDNNITHFKITIYTSKQCEFNTPGGEKKRSMLLSLGERISIASSYFTQIDVSLMYPLWISTKESNSTHNCTHFFV